jgi:phospholipase C
LPYPIKHLVVLMLENRSFDHMLGYLPGVNGIPKNWTNPLQLEGPLVPATPNARTVHDLIPDPGHEWVNVNVQIFENSAATGPATMQGFVIDYHTVSQDITQAPNIMKCFTPETLPVLHTLASQYAVCDRWFSSVPGSTIPNRLFSHAANSYGSLTQDAVAAPFPIRTIFEEMDVPPNPANYAIYTHGSSILMANEYLQTKKQDHFFDFAQHFANDAVNGDLPEYTFIEPAYDDDVNNGTYANSQHPDFPVDEGESLIIEVYNALCASPDWNDTLLLITYDEHGGIQDHVPPPNVSCAPSNAGLPGVPPSTSPPFAFDRLGVRVPAVFVSPRIAPNTFIRDQPFYEHCSIVATVRNLFCGPGAARPFNWREAQAPTFENLLVLDKPRPDVKLPDAVASAGVTPDDIAAANRMVASVNTLSLQAAAHNPAAEQAVITPAALPKQPPASRSPTDLMMLMAQSMNYSLQQRGIKPPTDINTIYTAQDAANFIRQANAAAGGAA